MNYRVEKMLEPVLSNAGFITPKDAWAAVKDVSPVSESHFYRCFRKIMYNRMRAGVAEKAGYGAYVIIKPLA
jgi:hypothetical protein